MRKFFWLPVLALAFSGCNEDEVSTEASSSGRSVVLTAGISGDASTRTLLGDDSGESTNVYWSDDESDAFTVEIGGTTYTFTKKGTTENATTAEFECANPPLELPAGNYTAKYPAEPITSYTTQVGTKEELKHHHYMEATFTVDAGETWEDVDLTFKTKVSIVKLTLSNADFKNAEVKNVQLSANDGTLVATTATFTGNADGEIEAYVAIEPKALTGIILYAECGDKEYLGTLSDKTPEEGNLYRASVAMTETEIPYVTFVAEAAQTLQISKAVEGLQYSVKGGAWTTLPANTPVSFGGEAGGLRLRGRNANGTAISQLDSDYAQISFGTDAKVACTGDIRTLVDYENHTGASTDEARFCNLFRECKVLTSAPALPATSLASNCYEYMFDGCSKLEIAPELPATTLTEACYTGMFKGCTSLTKAPALEATNLAESCYSYMFEGCTALTQAPALLATTLTEACYRNMFSGCTSLETAPTLPATSLVPSCYFYMFSGCSALKTAPELKATSLAQSCYSKMFSGCTSLETAPELEATSLAPSCYSYMFEGCSALETAPELNAMTLAKQCYYEMFKGCTSLKIAPELPATSLADFCYSYMFDGCTSLETAPKLEATKLASNCYWYMFYGCTSLTQAPKLEATSLAESCYSSMFSGCTSLETAPELPATTLANYCYSSMFKGCTKLTQAPKLEATDLVLSCYSNMFSGCSALKSVTMLATDVTVNLCLDNWLTGTASGGTLTVASGMQENATIRQYTPSEWKIVVQTAE